MSPLKVLYEDNHCIGVFKPSGVLVQGDQTGDESLMDRTRNWLKDKYSKPGNVFLGLVHRLDRPVAGVVVFAKTSKGASRLSASIRNREVEKVYWAKVSRAPETLAGAWEDYLVDSPEPAVARKPSSPGAKVARAEFKVIRTGPPCILEIQLITGRKHQIRLQLAHRGMPLLGDTRYGGPPGRGIGLLCQRMVFPHPTEARSLRVELAGEDLPREWR